MKFFGDKLEGGWDLEQLVRMVQTPESIELSSSDSAFPDLLTKPILYLTGKRVFVDISSIGVQDHNQRNVKSSLLGRMPQDV